MEIVREGTCKFNTGSWENLFIKLEGNKTNKQLIKQVVDDVGGEDADSQFVSHFLGLLFNHNVKAEHDGVLFLVLSMTEARITSFLWTGPMLMLKTGIFIPSRRPAGLPVIPEWMPER